MRAIYECNVRAYVWRNLRGATDECIVDEWPAIEWQAVEMHVVLLRRNRGSGGRGATATGGDGDRRGTGPNA
eukprot:2527335-Pyramimonas_sp.AAC.1